MRKSRCCTAVIWRFGPRRRRCSDCLKTWRVRCKKRGRPKLRADRRLARRVLVHRTGLAQLAKRRGLSPQALSHRVLKELERQLSKPYLPEVPPGASILICDGMWRTFNDSRWVLYLMAVRPTGANRATFIDPLLLRGNESKGGWEKALATIPSKLRRSIQALVVDDFGGCTTIASDNEWVLQLCHFHLLAQIKARLGARRKRAVKHRAKKLRAFKLVQLALLTQDAAQLESAIERLTAIHSTRGLQWKFRNLLREFIRRLGDYRAFRNHCHLNLPRTTGCAESMVRVIRDLMRRTRGIKTARAFRLWVTNYIRSRPEIACNGA